LKRDIFPPDADITYESFFDSAKQWTASSGFASLISLVMSIPLVGCHSCGAHRAVAWRKPILLYVKKTTEEWECRRLQK